MPERPTVHLLQNLRRALALFLLLLGLPAAACTPVFAVMFPLYGPAGFGAVATGLLWMLPAVVALKSILFGALAGYSTLRATGDMILGNVASSIPGLLIGFGVLMATTAIPLVGTLAACGFAAWLVGRQATRVVTAETGELQGLFANPKRLQLVLFIALFASTLAAFATSAFSVAQVDSSPSMYWGFKIASNFAGLLASVLITVVFEAAVIFRRNRKRGITPDQSMLNAIIKANLWTFFIAACIGAALRLPDRLRDPSFLDFSMLQP